ncbi:guanine nucleotide-binding protein G(I)/G(S)/G(O) subunit gamma-13 isoform X7 [Pteropus alecto]|uniref:guanine nucleotide-binding protein G(I)/G(S)/G(O) subunit gamma-13 isoform X7 n=1 Tax=Pteropus alecto TaxID=9402 RepID=UPI0007685123|nr:guanine nucleotide-binding protein G(I)/G(S)/G(O) subunit gamma-13 isoform X7 [Pteropus alecto]
MPTARAGIGRSSTACHWPASLSPSTHSSWRSTETCSMRGLTGCWKPQLSQVGSTCARVQSARNQDPALTLPHLRKIMRHLQQTLLLHDFFQNLHEELTCFFQSVLLSLHCFSFTNEKGEPLRPSCQAQLGSLSHRPK